jgi:hypothetical protein
MFYTTYLVKPGSTQCRGPDEVIIFGACCDKRGTRRPTNST